MIVASFGGGVNSTAMRIGMHERGEPVDLILFADTGGEKPHTYAHVLEFSEWLVAHGMPAITTLRGQQPQQLAKDAAARERAACAEICEQMAAELKPYCERNYTSEDLTVAELAAAIRDRSGEGRKSGPI